jgi:uncharacterized protein with FMN-binding domain
MKRSPIVLLGTVAGVAGVLMLNPNGQTLMASATPETGSGSGTDATNTASSGASNSASNSTPAASTTKTATGATGTATGDAVYVRYGYVQLEVTVENGTITQINEVQMPDQDGRSMMISQQAGPMLQSQVLKAQSAKINGVSGATYTSVGYQKSLQSALDQLGF